MNETTQPQAPRVGSHVWVVLKRILAAIVIVIAAISFFANTAGLVGVWIVRRPARDTVTALSTFVNDKLGMVDQALARVISRADEGQQSIARINDAAGKLGDLEEGSPLLAALADTARDDLAPKIEEVRAQAIALHDGVLSVNAALETLGSLEFINVPTLSDELSAVSERVVAAQSDVQDLRAAIDDAKAAASANLAAAVTERTVKIDNVLTQIKSTAARHRATAAQTQERVADLSRRLLRAINLLVLSLTALFLGVAAGQLLLIYVCWQYVRRGRFPLLRVVQ